MTASRRDETRETGKPRVGISACLLGENVRWDGGHRRSEAVARALGAWVAWVPVCPEVGIGLGVPRPPIRLDASGGPVRLRRNDDGLDLTRPMDAWAKEELRRLLAEGLDGMVLKARSPSCGVSGVEVLRSGGQATKDGEGRFARAVRIAGGGIPAVEDEQLAGTAVADRFLEIAFASRRLRGIGTPVPDVPALVAFHETHRLQLHAHGGAGAAALDRRVRRLRDKAPGVPVADWIGYRRAFLRQLARPITAVAASAIVALLEDAGIQGILAIPLRLADTEPGRTRRQPRPIAGEIGSWAASLGPRDLAAQTLCLSDPMERQARGSA